MKSTYKTMGGKYRQEGDYLLPNLETPENPNVVFGVNAAASICVSISKHSTPQ